MSEICLLPCPGGSGRTNNVQQGCLIKKRFWHCIRQVSVRPRCKYVQTASGAVIVRTNPVRAIRTAAGDAYRCGRCVPRANHTYRCGLHGPHAVCTNIYRPPAERFIPPPVCTNRTARFSYRWRFSRTARGIVRDLLYSDWLINVASASSQYNDVCLNERILRYS